MSRIHTEIEDTVDREGMLAWFASFSVVGALPEPDRTELLERIAAILDRHAVTSVRRRWRAELWVTRRRG